MQSRRWMRCVVPMAIALAISACATATGGSVAQPEAAQPEAAQPEAAHPEAAHPEAAHPEAAQPDGEDPTQRISKEEAFDRVSDNGTKFLGTWITVSLKDGNWHISAISKSARPACYYVVDGVRGEVLLQSDPVADVPQEYLQTPATESYRVEQREGGNVWTRQAATPPKTE